MSQLPADQAIIRLKENEDRFNEFINGDGYTSTDGEVVPGLSEVIYNISTFNSRGDWATATAYAIKDLVKYSGTWYVALEAHTSSAAFATDEATKWRIYQGVTLADLADDGAALVGFGALTVAEALDAVNAAYQNLRPAVIRQHWGVLHGAWYIDGEADSTFTVSTGSAAGTYQIFVTSTTGLVPYQLFCYLGTDGQYYSTVIEAASGGIIDVFYPLEAAVATGVNAFSFYLNQSHPNVYGFRAIADYALRQMEAGAFREAVTIKSFRDLYTNRASIFTAISDGVMTMANGGIMNWRVPGTPTVPALNFGTAAGGGGIRTIAITLEVESVHKLRVLLNKGSGGVGTIKVKDQDGNELLSIATASTSKVEYVEGFFMPTKDKTVYVEFKKTSAAGFMQLSEIDIIKCADGVGSINHSTHVCLGDSWFAMTGIVARLADRLQGATFVNAGVGGQTLIEMLARFDTDVTPYNPKFVWVNSSTNEIGRDYPVATYTTNLRLMLAKIASIGAKAILFDATVGARTLAGHADYAMTAASHEYEFGTYAIPRKREAVSAAPATVYTDYIDVQTGFGTVADTVTVNELCLGVMPVGTKITFERYSQTGVGVGKEVQIGFATNFTNAYDASMSMVIPTNVNFTGPDATTLTSVASRVLVIRRKNTSGGAAEFGAVMKLKIERPI